MIQRTHDNLRWQLADDFAARLEAVLAAPPKIIKESSAKLVACHEVDGRSYYVKRYRHGAFAFRPLKFLLKQSQAKQEWLLAGECRERGVATVRHVALGERWSWRGLLESVIITETFDGVPLDESHKDHFRAAIEFVREIARAGVSHGDFHPSNLLINEASGELRLIDLHGAKTFQGEVLDQGRSMLVQLAAMLPLPVDDDVHGSSRVWRRQAFAKRSKRCLKTNAEFTQKQLGRLRWQVRRDQLGSEMEAILRDPDKFLAHAKMLKAGRSSTVGAANGMVLKRYNFKKPLNLLKDVFRGSRGRRGFRKSYHLQLCGFPTPLVVATADHRVLGVPFRSYILMHGIPGATSAAQWNGDIGQALGLFIGWLHHEGFTHRDLKETNILFDQRGTPLLIDLDGLVYVGCLKPKEAAANLRRLARGMAQAGKLTRHNVLRFLLEYCRLRGVRPRVLFPRS